MHEYIQENEYMFKVNNANTMQRNKWETCLKLTKYYQNVANEVALKQAVVSWEHYFNTQEQLYKNTGLTICKELRDLEFSGHKIKLQNQITQNDITLWVID